MAKWLILPVSILTSNLIVFCSGNWQKQFDPSLTRRREFHTENGESRFHRIFFFFEDLIKNNYFLKIWSKTTIFWRFDWKRIFFKDLIEKKYFLKIWLKKNYFLKIWSKTTIFWRFDWKRIFFKIHFHYFFAIERLVWIKTSS